MRRSQRDSGSLPLRNLVTNPEFETASGNGAIRTNLCAHPNLEGFGGTVALRTNLCINPRGVNTYDPYASAVTITPNVAITGHPDGITTAARVTYGAGTTNPGIAIVNPLTSGVKYAASAWVYHETVGGGSQGLAQAGIASSPGAPAIVAGVWQKITWTFTANGTSHLGFRVSSNTADGAYLITGILVELSTANGSFFDGATAAQTNLVKTAATPLSGVTITTGISYAGSTWNRASVIVGTGALIARQNVLLSDLGAGGKTYTVSVTVANDQAFSQAVSLDWCDTNYFNFTLAPGEVRRVVTTGSRAAYDSTYRFSDIQITQSSTEARSVLFKDWLIEEGTTSGDYYGATGDFTYAWTGTPNASTSVQNAPGVSGFMSASTGVPYSSVVNPYMGTRCAGVITKGGNGDGGYWLDSVVTAATTYTFSTWVKLMSSVGTLSVVLRWKDASNNILSDGGGNIHTSLTIGQWTRISWTETAPANATKLQPMLRVYSSSYTATTFYVDGCLIESHPALLDYFDGNTVAAGDFTYLWTGTAQASTSQQRGNGLPGVTAGNSQVIQSSEWCATGTKSLRIIPNTQYNTSSAIMLSGSQLERGKMYTAIATRRLTAPLTGTLSAYAGSIIFVHTSVGTFYSNFIVNSAGIGVARLKFFLADNGTSWTLRLGHGGAAGSGEVWWDNFMVVEGDYDGDFIDGTKPFSKWDGTAHASTSIGYSSSLLQIAGEPDRDITGVGDTGASVVDGFAARTFYFVYEVTDINLASWEACYYHSNGPSGGISFQSQAAGIPNMIPRADFPGGTANANLNVVNGRVPGRRHVMAMAFPQGLTGVTGNLNGGGNLTLNYANPGAVGWDNGRLNSADRPGVKPVRGIMYWGEHDLATRTAISRYLGNKYGALVA